MSVDDRNILPNGYILQSYQLSKVIGRGSYGITYLANDQYLNRKVAIKEYLPREYAVRKEDFSVRPVSDKQKEMFEWGLNNFLLEARTLAKFNHPNIIKVISVVEKNNTAYMVMEFEEGSDLSKVYRKSGVLTEQQLLHYFVPIVEGLSVVHNLGFIHRDIKPANIYVRSDTSTVLLDFGSARQTVDNDADVLTTLVTAGFAPYEQYHQSKFDQGPWSDIYSLGATLYYCITGNKPADALLRGSSLLKKLSDPYVPVQQFAKANYSDNFLLAIDQALAFNINDRPNNAQLWSNLLTGKESAKLFPSKARDQKQEFYPRTVPLGADIIAPMDVVLASTPNITKENNLTSNIRKISGFIGAFIKISVSAITGVTTATANGLFYGLKSIVDGCKNLSGTTMSLLSLVLIVIPASYYLYETVGLGANFKTTFNSDIDSHAKNNIASKSSSETTKEIEHAEQKPIDTINNDQPMSNKTVVVKKVVETATTTPSNIKETPPVIKPLSPTGNAQCQKRKRQEVVAIAKQVIIRDLLSQAKLAVTQKRYSVPVKDNAIFHYQKILALDPDHLKAKAGLKNIEDIYVEIVDKYIARHSWKIAAKNIAKISAISTSKSTIIAKLNKKLKQEKRRFEQLTEILNQAQTSYEKSRLTRPKNKNALHYYNLALDLDPKNKQAETGLKNIFDKLSIVLVRQIKTKRVKKSKRTFTILKSIQADSKIVSDSLPIITALQIEHDKIQILLTDAKKDFINNRISLPKNNNALSKYQAALKIDKNNNPAKTGIKQIFTYYVSNYYRQVDNNKFSKAKQTLRSLRNIGYPKKKITTLRKFAKLEKKTRINTAIIQELLNKIENGLMSHDLKMLEQISVFKTKKKKYIVDLLNYYTDFSVSIANQKYSKKRSRTTASVVLSNLESVDDDMFVIPDDIKIKIKIEQGKSKKWKVYW